METFIYCSAIHDLIKPRELIIKIAMKNAFGRRRGKIEINLHTKASYYIYYRKCIIKNEIPKPSIQ